MLAFDSPWDTIFFVAACIAWVAVVLKTFANSDGDFLVMLVWGGAVGFWVLLLAHTVAYGR